MNALTYYIFRQLTGPFVFILATLTGIAWLSQSLRYVDFIVNRGLSLGTFFYLTGLLTPSLIAMLIPFSMFIAVIFVYKRLNTDSELIVMRAVGFSHWQLVKPALYLGAAATIVSYILQLYFSPLGYRTFRDLQFTLRSDYASILLQEGVFTPLTSGITVYVRERHGGGELRGILVHDNRNHDRPVTMMAEKGALVRTEEGPRFVLVQGNRQEVDKKTGSLSFLYFDENTVDLGLYTDTTQIRWRDPRERFLHELFAPGPGIDDQNFRNKLTAEGHSRLTNPIYILVMGVLGAFGILAGQFSRRSQWKLVTGLVMAGVLVQILSLSMVNVVSKNLILAPLQYIVPAVLLIGLCSALIRGITIQFGLPRFLSFRPLIKLQKGES